MPTFSQTFGSASEHRAWLFSQAKLPAGFRVGTAALEFVPVEVSKPSKMTLTLIALDAPTPSFALMFTRNAFCGAPVTIGRQRLSEPSLGALIVNNKVSNVAALNGVAASERVCTAVAEQLRIKPQQVLPCSTGVIGWQLPVDAMLESIPRVASALGAESALPAAEGIVTTDLFPKIRRADFSGSGSIVGIAKGAGMIEPNLATMLVFLMTDLDVPREPLREILARVVEQTFNCISIDSDTSTSDTVALVSSRKVPCSDLGAFEKSLLQVCRELCDDIVRNGEGVHHVVRVRVSGAPTQALARGVGKSIVNSPLVQCAVCGNDPNVGRLIMAVGKFLGSESAGRAIDTSRCELSMGGLPIFSEGVFRLNAQTETKLVEHLKSAELYSSVAPKDGMNFVPPVRFPPHQRSVEIEVDLRAGGESCVVIGSDRSHEYISENADYRS